MEKKRKKIDVLNYSDKLIRI